MSGKRRSLVLVIAALFLGGGLLVDTGWGAPQRGGGRGGAHGGGAGGAGRSGGGGGNFGGASRGGGFGGGSRPSTPSLGGGRSPSAGNFDRSSASRPAVSRPQQGAFPGGERTGGGWMPPDRSAPAGFPNRTGPGQSAGGGLAAGNRAGTGNLSAFAGGGQGRLSSTLPGFTGPEGGGGILPGSPAGRPRTGNLTEDGQAGQFGRPFGDSPRQSDGGVGDFLGMDRPLRPQALPAGVPSRDSGLSPANRAGAGGASGGNQALVNNRPVNIGEVHTGNNSVIHQRMSWAGIGQNSVAAINGRWQNQMGELHGWPARNPARISYCSHWGNGVRNNVGWRYSHCFNDDWWVHHPHGWCGWHYGWRFNSHPWGYWWTVPTYSTLTGWFAWQAPAEVWAQPVYYDYGQGGNVVYENNSVLILGSEVASAGEFAQSAADLATVAPPANDQDAAAAEWMALGTFAVSAGETDTTPSRVLQLAVNRAGVISGTLYNSQTDRSDSVQGQVDRETQRVAFRTGDSDSVVMETGLYNLTQDSVPVLVHFGTDRVENWLLARLESPDHGNPVGGQQSN